MIKTDRIVFLDYLRVIACFMVIIIHSCEPFYLGGKGTFILNSTNALLVTLIDSAFRAAVPLFVITSSFLLFPLKGSASAFFKKRFVRVLVPLVVWSLLYALIPLYGAEPSIGANLKQLIFNFTPASGHLWFVYMLLGVYVLMWMLSGWISTLTKKQEQVFIAVWAFTTLFPFLRQLASNGELWGEANWNEFGAFYYVSGFVGYIVIGHYFRTRVGEISWKRTLAIAVPMFLVGYAITAVWFWYKIPKSYPVNESLSLAVLMEQSWRFCTFGVALTTIAFFLLIRKFTSAGWGYRHIILPISNLSYGMYLMHIFFLVFWNAMLIRWGFTPLATIALTAVLTFLTSAIVSKAISFLPGSKYIVG